MPALPAVTASMEPEASTTSLLSTYNTTSSSTVALPSSISSFSISSNSSSLSSNQISSSIIGAAHTASISPAPTNPLATTDSASSSSPSVSADPLSVDSDLQTVASTLPKYLVAGGIALGVFILLGILSFWWKRRRRRNKHFDEEDHTCFKDKIRRDQRERLGSVAASTRPGSAAGSRAGSQEPARSSEAKSSVEKAGWTRVASSRTKARHDGLASPTSFRGSPLSTASETSTLVESPKPTSPITPGASFLEDEPFVLVSRSRSPRPGTKSTPQDPRRKTYTGNRPAYSPSTGHKSIPHGEKSSEGGEGHIMVLADTGGEEMVAVPTLNK